jgi:uncharacterized protein YciI
MHYILYCLDDPTKSELRAATRDAHLTYVADVGAAIKIAGPITDDEGASIGSMFIVDFNDQLAAEAFAANDPYAQAGLFSRVDVRPFKWLITNGKRIY